VRRVLIAVLGSVVALAGIAVIPPSGPRTLRAFDADRMASLEVDMWQAYYAHENLRLFRGLVTMTHEQYRYPWGKSLRASFYLARAARTFGDSRSDYERVLPDLERAYSIAKDWTNSSFDPAAVARAELAWWVARRVPGQDAPENVGRLIAQENAQLFGVSEAKVLDSSVLRARAGKLRDDGGTRADWAQVSALLHQSYRGLYTAVQ
jgi:hypothetical protein